MSKMRDIASGDNLASERTFNPKMAFEIDIDGLPHEEPAAAKIDSNVTAECQAACQVGVSGSAFLHVATTRANSLPASAPSPKALREQIAALHANAFEGQ